MDQDARIEALTQSLELAVSLHNDLEKQTAARFAETAAQIRETAVLVGNITLLVQRHEDRLDKLETKKP